MFMQVKNHKPTGFKGIKDFKYLTIQSYSGPCADKYSFKCKYLSASRSQVNKNCVLPVFNYFLQTNSACNDAKGIVTAMYNHM